MRQTGFIAVVAMVVAGCQPTSIHGGEALAAASSINPAPSLTTQQLLAPPTTSWVTIGGTLYNLRYSPLKLINRDNAGILPWAMARRLSALPMDACSGSQFSLMACQVIDLETGYSP